VPSIRCVLKGGQILSYLKILLFVGLLADTEVH
jgi:hypothetical protein